MDASCTGAVRRCGGRRRAPWRWASRPGWPPHRLPTAHREARARGRGGRECRHEPGGEGERRPGLPGRDAAMPGGARVAREPGKEGGGGANPCTTRPPRGDRVRKAEGRGPGLSSRPAGGGARGKRPPPLRPPWLSGGREEWTSGGTGSTGPRACGTDTRRPPAPRPLPPQGITGCPAMRWKAPRAVAQGKPPRARRRGRTSPGAARAGRGRGGRAAGRKEAGKEGGGGANPCTTRPPAGGSSEEGRGPGPRPLLSTGGRRRSREATTPAPTSLAQRREGGMDLRRNGLDRSPRLRDGRRPETRAGPRARPPGHPPHACVAAVPTAGHHRRARPC